MRKVCFIAPLNDLSGANLSLVELINELGNSCDITVVVPRKGPLYIRLQEMGIKTKVIFSGTWVKRKTDSTVKTLIKKISNHFAEARFESLFKKEKFDIIHFNSSVYGCGASSALKLGIPYIWHIRELAEENFELIFFDKAKSFDLISKSERTIAISDFVNQKMNLNSVVIYDGMVPFEGDIKSSGKDRKELVLIGAISKDKGQIDAIRAVKCLKDKYGKDIKLTIVGKVSDEAYMSLVKKEITSDIDVVFEGYKEDVFKYRDGRFIALMCSPKEALGRVTLEAMNHGQIVIGADGGATSKIIEDGVTGYLYTPGDYENLARVISCVLDNEDSGVSVRAHKAVCERYNIKDTAQKVKELYDEVIR